MAYPAAVREAWQAELAGIREKGIYKEERFIHSPQASHITVEFPSGAELKEVVNLCANNYLGLSPSLMTNPASTSPFRQNAAFASSVSRRSVVALRISSTLMAEAAMGGGTALLNR